MESFRVTVSLAGKERTLVKLSPSLSWADASNEIRDVLRLPPTSVFTVRVAGNLVTRVKDLCENDELLITLEQPQPSGARVLPSESNQLPGLTAHGGFAGGAGGDYALERMQRAQAGLPLGGRNPALACLLMRKGTNLVPPLLSRSAAEQMKQRVAHTRLLAAQAAALQAAASKRQRKVLSVGEEEGESGRGGGEEGDEEAGAAHRPPQGKAARSEQQKGSAVPRGPG